MILKEIAGYRRVLLLQGPIGPFFRRLGRHLEREGCEVFKINLNGGDWLFYPSGPRVTEYRGKPRNWPGFISRHLERNRIEAMVLFGDCRFYHRVAIRCARRLGLPVYVFEEGYLRPDYVTLERSGVNGFSSVPRDPEFYRRLPALPEPAPKPVGKSGFWGGLVFSILYGLAGFALRGRYPQYRHHRDYFSLSHALCWLRSFSRRAVYAIREQDVHRLLSNEYRGRYFLVPLQVYDDAQVEFHSRFDGVEEFIEEVIASFARHARPDHLLVFKHHPVDRGFRDYAALLGNLALAHGVAGRVLYVHDPHLPTLLECARGTVVINSTTGLSSALHGTPVMVLGDAVYDVPGIAFAGTLDQFWTANPMVDRELFSRFRQFLLNTTQINGSFYSPTTFNFSSPPSARLLAGLSSVSGAAPLTARRVARRRGQRQGQAALAGPILVAAETARSDRPVESASEAPPRRDAF